jgi:hypothetical protein
MHSVGTGFAAALAFSLTTDLKLLFVYRACDKAPCTQCQKWGPVFPRDKREAFARRSCSNNKLEWDDDSRISHPTLMTGIARH